MLMEREKLLIHGLKLFDVEADAVPGIVLSLPSPEQQDALMAWMCENREATTSEILEKTAQLVRWKGPDTQSAETATKDLP